MTFCTDRIDTTEAQTRLLAYWRSLRDSQGRVMRASLCPGQLRRYLANISLVAVGPDGKARFRLAGSALRDIFGIEARGRYVSEVSGLSAEAWVDGLAYVCETARPACGISTHDDVRYAWLRLPVYDHTARLNLVCCHDELLVDALSAPAEPHIPALMHQAGLRKAA